MIYEDFDLIQQSLDGDQQAFATLVEKYQKQIHTLVWQKIGDFHIAQEITQDAFLTAYQKLSTLTNPNRFAGWLYVIANRKCIAWHRKKSPQLQSLEATDPAELEEVYYSEYMAQQREEAVNQKQRAVVQKLLSKLQESERTVVNLYYIAEMTCEDIGKFLGVSPNTVMSRLHRARKRLRKEEVVIKENLSSFQLPAELTENIMKEITRLNPVVPSGNKPLVPLAVSTAAAILVILLIGVGAQNLIRFQKPYNMEATSNPTVEIVETQLVLHSPTEPAVRNRVGRTDVAGQSNGAGQGPDETLIASAQVDEDEFSKSKSQWIQTKGLEGGAVSFLHATTRGDMYAGTLSDLYRLTDDGSTWKLVNTRNARSLKAQNMGVGWGAMAERGDTLYLATDTEVLASTDRGETWETIGTHPGGMPIDMVITEQELYLGFRDGVFRSKDGGTSWLRWTHLINEQTGNKIRAIASIKSTLFAATDKGLYRLNDDIWEKISVGRRNRQEKADDIHALAVAGNELYVVIADGEKSKEIRSVGIPSGDMKSITIFGWELYHSNDRGDSWNLIAQKDEITDKKNKMYFPLQTLGPRGHQFPFTGMVPNTKVKIAASIDRIVVLDSDYQSYSIDGDGTWVLDDTSSHSGIHTISPTPVMLNPNTIYTSNAYGIYRSTNGGKSWQQFNSGLTGTTILTLAAANDSLFAITPERLVTSSDGGESWTNVFRPGGDFTMIMKKSNGTLYVRTDNMIAGIYNIGDMNIFRISTKNSKKTLILATPTFQPNNLLAGEVPRNFAVSSTTYFAEYHKKLFRWKPGTTEWYDTGLIDEGEPPPSDEFADILDYTGFKLAVSGKIVYVGKRNGHLMQSFDEGNNWNDVTANLPFSVERFNAITFAGQNVYVSTDKGVVRSSNGTDWHIVTDAEEKHLVVDRFAVDDTTVYAQTNQKVYQLKKGSDTWKQITPEIPYPVSSLDVDGNTLYVGTFGSGVLRFTIGE